ncbi:hypothetical protein DYB25_008423 [Aphanomyces astaci]|uniref:Chromosome segregation in meiosis protein 3 domain-containing protein n=1 Tax=Aphanomyces astaci TaxID=112090 RepID=A0A397BHD7_APHAT|nr:hypothetical protein DYB25_008423 [Aphanomyces astaci]RHZ03439.1 hypothetical protein DYB26_008045 [Aphanomyces astaci]
MSGWEDSSAVLGSYGDSASKKRERALDMTEEDAPLDEENKDDEPVPLKVTKKRATFSEQHLLGPRGLSLVYSTFPTHFNRAVTHGNEGEALRELITAYKEWAYELYPGLNFEDLVDKTEALAKKAAVSSFIADLRQQERKRGEPEEDVPAPPTAHEQWVAMKDYEDALLKEQRASEPPKESGGQDARPRGGFHIEDEGEAEFELPTSLQQLDEDSGSEAEFDFTTVSHRPLVDAADGHMEDEPGAEEHAALPLEEGVPPPHESAPDVAAVDDATAAQANVETK